MENKANWQPVTFKAGKTLAWNTDMPKNSNEVNTFNPPPNHSGYVVIQGRKVIGPRYRYYETAWENAGAGSVTSFDLAEKNMWV